MSVELEGWSSLRRCRGRWSLSSFLVLLPEVGLLAWLPPVSADPNEPSGLLVDPSNSSSEALKDE